jgi:hypothetical protein
LFAWHLESTVWRHCKPCLALQLAESAEKVLTETATSRYHTRLSQLSDSQINNLTFPGADFLSDNCGTSSRTQAPRISQFVPTLSEAQFVRLGAANLSFILR